MRMRRTYYRHYGIDKEEEKKIKAYCLNLDEEDKNILWQAAMRANGFMAKKIYRSLTERLSYEDLDKEEYMVVGKEDFYGYQRACVNYFKNLLIFAGRYNI